VPLFHLDTVANVGIIVNWSVYGTSVPAYQAIRKDSGDSSGVRASLINASAIFQCNHGEFPAAGLVGPFRVFCRYRLSDPAAVGASLRFTFRVGGVDKAVGVVAPTGAWATSSAEYRKDPGTARVTLTALQDLTLRLLVVAPPSAGTIEVSELWLEEETAEGIYRYDAAEAVLPDAIVGPLLWATAGAQPAAIVAPGSNFLEILDTSLVDGRAYLFSVVPDVLKPGYSTHLETRFAFPALIGLAGGNYVPLAYEDGSGGIILVLFIEGSTYYLGLLDSGADFNDRTKYLALEPWPGGISPSVFYHVRMEIRRSRAPSDLGLVEVFIDHASTPLLSVPYISFAPNVFAPRVSFGAFPSMAWVWIDYVTFQTVREFGAAFTHWDQLEGDANCVVSADSTDIGICKLTPLKLLPEVVAGQSNYACKLSASGVVSPCGIRQVALVEPFTYDIILDYRDDVAVVASALRVTLQRFSDLFYWDEAGGSWTNIPAYFDMLHSATRTSVGITGGVPFAARDTLIITLEYNFTAPPGAYNIWIYRVLLQPQ
jgi:hypothetical protein